jgi:Family of unknown function (DUF6496)
MPWQEVMHKFKAGKLHSGSAHGPKVGNRKQAVAIMLSEKRKGTHETSSMRGLRKAAK